MAVFVLAGCDTPADDASNGSDSDEGGTQAASNAPGSQGSFGLAETGWLTIGVDGAVQTTFFDPGGRYRDLRNNVLLAEGHWERRSDGKVCFEPDRGLGACWSTSEIDDNGKALATDGDGRSIEITRVTYFAPPPVEETDEPDS